MIPCLLTRAVVCLQALIALLPFVQDLLSELWVSTIDPTDTTTLVNPPASACKTPFYRSLVQVLLTMRSKQHHQRQQQGQQRPAPQQATAQAPVLSQGQRPPRTRAGQLVCSLLQRRVIPSSGQSARAATRSASPTVWQQQQRTAMRRWWLRSAFCVRGVRHRWRGACGGIPRGAVRQRGRTSAHRRRGGVTNTPWSCCKLNTQPHSPPTHNYTLRRYASVASYNVIGARSLFTRVLSK